MWDFIKDNWIQLFWGLIAFVELIVRLTPSEKDNSILNKIKRVLDILIPNSKKKPKEDSEKLIKNKATLKAFFDSGNVPTKEEYATLINSLIIPSGTH